MNDFLILAIVVLVFGFLVYLLPWIVERRRHNMISQIGPPELWPNMELHIAFSNHICKYPEIEIAFDKKAFVFEFVSVIKNSFNDLTEYNGFLTEC
jgi:hypothetical protein